MIPGDAGWQVHEKAVDQQVNLCAVISFATKPCFQMRDSIKVYYI
jgi:hypothetical protein